MFLGGNGAKNPRKAFGTFLRLSDNAVDDRAVLLSEKEFAKIKSATAVCDTNTQARRWREEKDAELKRKMVELEKLREENERSEFVEDESEEAKKMKQEIRVKAELKLLEMDEDIRKLNELIKYVECQAVRDEQVKEKHKKMKELRAEDAQLRARLDEFQRQRDEQINLQKKSEKESAEKFSVNIREQIAAKELRRFQLLQQREQETSHVNDVVASFHESEKRNKMNRKQEQQRIRNELLHSIAARRIQRQEERNRETEIERKIQEQMKEQMEIAAERSIKIEEMRKERQIKMQEHALEHAKRQLVADKARKGLLRDRTNSEALEAKWRMEEVEAAKRKLKEEEELKDFRRQQLKEKTEMKLELEAKERQLMAAIEKHNKQLHEKELEEEMRKLEMNGEFTDAIRRQVREKQRRQRNKLIELTEFYKDRKADDEKRKETVSNYKQQKLDNLRSEKIPDKLIGVVARKFKF